MILDQALDATTRPAWLDAWPMIDALVDAYVLDRTVVPVPGAVDPEGFARVVRPVIESSLRGRETLLVQLRVAAANNPGRVHRLREIVEKRDTPPEPPSDDDDRSRVVALAPSMVAELGLPAAAQIARQVDDPPRPAHPHQGRTRPGTAAPIRAGSTSATTAGSPRR
jgi:hypothetical protein